jgi:quinolinate synthase
MKLNSLEKVRDVLAAPRPDQMVSLDEPMRIRALRSLERMFDLAGAS